MNFTNLPVVRAVIVAILELVLTNRPIFVALGVFRNVCSCNVVTVLLGTLIWVKLIMDEDRPK